MTHDPVVFVRVAPDLHARLHATAETLGVSVSELVRALLADALPILAELADPADA